LRRTCMPAKHTATNELSLSAPLSKVERTF
jgi:hypothetical protein